MIGTLDSPPARAAAAIITTGDLLGERLLLPGGLPYLRIIYCEEDIVTIDYLLGGGYCYY